MAAVSYNRTDQVLDLTYAVDISALANVAIIVITFVILGAVFVLGRRPATSLGDAQPLHEIPQKQLARSARG
jgi:hypothetical protein